MTLERVGDSKDYRHSHTTILQSESIRIEDRVENGKTIRNYHIRVGAEMETIANDYGNDSYRIDVFIENEKGDTIGKY